MNSFIDSSIKQFKYYKSLVDKSVDQLNDIQLFEAYAKSEENNSIAVIMQHIMGNMLSRWTNFISEDGEKPWRNRESEFACLIKTRTELLPKWDSAWDVLFDTLSKLEKEDLEKTVYIRNMGHSVVEAIQRQLCHYSYHVGQIVFEAKQHLGEQWLSLSIPRGESKSYNDSKFALKKRKAHFTDEYLRDES